MATKKTTNNTSVPTPSQVTFNPAALPAAKAPTLAQLAAQQKAILASVTQGAAQAKTQLATAQANQASTIAENTTLGTSLGATVDTTGHITPPTGGYTASGLASVPPPAPPTTGPSTAVAAVNRSSIILNFLHSIGLDSVAGTVTNWANQGYSYDSMVNMLRTSPETKAAYTARFPALAQLQTTDPTIDEGQYIAKENKDRDLLYTYLGDGAKKYDTTAQLGSLMTNYKSSVELQSNLTAIHDAINGSPEQKAWLKNNLGLSDQDIAAAWLDPSATADMVSRRDVASQIGGAGLASGFGNLTQAQAELLASQGVTGAQAQNTFAKIGNEGQLMQNLPGSDTGAVSQDQLLSGAFNGGTDAQATASVQAKRVAEFQAGGGAVADSSGISGLRSAATP